MIAVLTQRMPQKLNFIVIDDSRLDCFIAEKVIQSSGRSGSVKSFMMAAEALDYIRTAPDSDGKTIILVDIQMPVMNGFDFLEAFEKHFSADTQNRYAINLLSSSINESDRLKARGYKFVKEFISKPLTAASLKGVLESAA
jgi:CheY-like chemotaxis protein